MGEEGGREGEEGGRERREGEEGGRVGEEGGIDYRVEGLEAAHAKNYPHIARSWRELQKVSEFFPSNKTFAAEMATSTGQSRV